LAQAILATRRPPLNAAFPVPCMASEAKTRAADLRALSARLAFAARTGCRVLGSLDQARFLSPIYDVLSDIGGTLAAYNADAGLRLECAPAYVQREISLLASVASPSCPPPAFPPSPSAPSPATPAKHVHFGAASVKHFVTDGNMNKHPGKGDPSSGSRRRCASSPDVVARGRARARRLRAQRSSRRLFAACLSTAYDTNEGGQLQGEPPSVVAASRAMAEEVKETCDELADLRSQLLDMGNQIAALNLGGIDVLSQRLAPASEALGSEIERVASPAVGSERRFDVPNVPTVEPPAVVCAPVSEDGPRGLRSDLGDSPAATVLSLDHDEQYFDGLRRTLQLEAFSCKMHERLLAVDASLACDAPPMSGKLRRRLKRASVARVMDEAASSLFG